MFCTAKGPLIVQGPNQRFCDFWEILYGEKAVANSMHMDNIGRILVKESTDSIPRKSSGPVVIIG
jgi:hypothetical protein